MKKVFKIILGVFILVAFLFACLLVLGFTRRFEKNKTDLVIARINSTKITLGDVMGENLPAKPDQLLSDSTIAGFDVNNNRIRDDVELAIFEKYPNSAKIRSAMLQYAQALQLELTEVFNSETLVEVLRKRSHGQSCIDETDIDFKITDSRVKEIENIVLNTDMRKKLREGNLNYMTTYSVPAIQEECDISLSSLSN